MRLSLRSSPPRLFVFGLGYVGRALAGRLAAQGWRIAGSARDAAEAARVAALGFLPARLDDDDALAAAMAEAEAILVAAPPTPAGCPGLAAIGRTDQVRLIGFEAMQREAILVGVNGDGGQA